VYHSIHLVVQAVAFQVVSTKAISFKGTLLPTHAEFPIEVKHTFPLNRKKFICKEEVYISDDKHESHYRKGHVRNEGKRHKKEALGQPRLDRVANKGRAIGAELAGTIEADMTFLKNEGHIEPVPPSIYSTYSRDECLHYAVTFDLVMIVDGRNLRYEARWPPRKAGKQTSQQSHVKAQGQICIAAAFKPGTA
jgi:hypothetical protein